MFKAQVESLKEVLEKVCDDIYDLETMLKEKKKELADVKQGLASMERLQAKYEPIKLAKKEECTE